VIYRPKPEPTRSQGGCLPSPADQCDRWCHAAHIRGALCVHGLAGQALVRLWGLSGSDSPTGPARSPCDLCGRPVEYDRPGVPVDHWTPSGRVCGAPQVARELAALDRRTRAAQLRPERRHGHRYGWDWCPTCSCCSDLMRMFGGSDCPTCHGRGVVVR